MSSRKRAWMTDGASALRFSSVEVLLCGNPVVDQHDFPNKSYRRALPTRFARATTVHVPMRLTMPPDFSRLVGKISEAGFAPEAWPEFLESLTGALGVAGAACIIANKKTRRVDWVCFSGLSAEFRSDYVNYYAALDPFSPLLNVDVGWKRLLESLPDTILRKSEWYNDFVLSCGVRDILGARLVETSSHVATFGLHQQIGRRFADETAAIMGIVAAPLSLAMAQHIRRLFRSTVQDAEAGIISNGTRYYFHVTNGRQYRDEIGKVFPSHQEAVAYPAVVAGELARDGDWNGFVVSVTDADGAVIARVPVEK